MHHPQGRNANGSGSDSDSAGCVNHWQWFGSHSSLIMNGSDKLQDVCGLVEIQVSYAF